MSALLMVLLALKGANSISSNCINFDLALEICYECDLGFFLSSDICLTSCPTGFLDNGLGGCDQSYASLQLINTKFYEVKNLASIEIGDFSASSLIISDPVGNFVPTLDRGCYSHKSSFISSNSNIFLSPKFTLKLYIKPMSTGVILSLADTLIVTIVGISINVNLNVYSQSSSSESLVTSSTLINLNNWQKLEFIISAESSTTISCQIILNSVANVEYFSNSEILQSALGNIYLGDSMSIDPMKGFYYLIEFWNEINTNELPVFYLNDCDYLNYFNGSHCLPCDPNCGEVNCVRPSDCITCPYSSCSSCSGYSISDCLSCDNGETAPHCCDYLCSSCTSLGLCSTCQPGNHQTFSVCVAVLPSGYTSDQAIPSSAIFLNFMQNPFINYFGSFSSSNYPNKVRSRGAYFNGNSTLLNSYRFVLAVKFSIVLLLKSEKNDRMPLVYLPGFFSIYSTGDFINATLVKFDGVKQNYLSSGDFNDFEWVYVTVIVDNDGVFTTFTVFINQDQRSQKTCTGLMRMDEVYLYLGTDLQDNFVGFLTSFEVFIGSLDLYGFTAVKCSNYWDGSCIEDCPYLSYLENSQCLTCSATCTENCVRGSACTLCYDPKCDQCDSYLSGTCTLCQIGYQVLSGSCSCMDVSICGTCDPSCLTCLGSGIFNCTSCSTTYKKVYNGFCLSACPSPCSSNSTTCICSADQVFDLKLESISFYSPLGYFTSGTDGSSFDTNDPLMQDKRGAYFKSSSFMKQSLVLSQIFLLNLWVKVEVAGSFIRKTKFYIEFLANGVVETGFWMSGMKFTLQVNFVFGVWGNLKMTMDCVNINWKD